MADDTKSAADVKVGSADPPADAAAPPETVGAFFTRVENYLVQQVQKADGMGADGESASLRGCLATMLAEVRAAKPGGI